MTILKHYISTSCISFTFSCLFYLLFSLLTIFPPMNEALIIHMLVISISINCLIFLHIGYLFRILFFCDSSNY